MKYISFVLLWGLLGNIYVFGVTTQSGDLIDHIQKTYALSADYPILIFDRDEISWRFLIEDALEKQDEDKRLDIISRYIDERVGLQIEKDQLVAYETYLYTVTGSALALPVINSDRNAFLFCAVLPPSSNMSARLMLERILGFDAPGVYEGIGYDRIKIRMDYDVLIHYSLLHEVGHCYDDRFMIKFYSAYGEDIGLMHQAESFAETMGLFLLEQEGYHGYAEKRAQLRAMYSRVAGPYFAQNPSNGMGSQAYPSAGSIYYLSPSILAADKILNERDEELLGADIPSLVDISEKIVHTHALGERSLSAVTTLLRDGAEQAITSYTEMQQSWPEFFSKPLEDLLNYHSYTSEIRNEVISHDQLPVLHGEDLLPMTIADFCPAYRTKDKNLFFYLLDHFRNNLQKVSSDNEGQKVRSEQLENIWKAVYQYCRENEF